MIKKGVEQLAKKIEREIVQKGEEITTLIGDEAMKVTPMRTGRLRDAQYRRVDKIEGGYRATVGYWNAAVYNPGKNYDFYYLWYVHETPDVGMSGLGSPEKGFGTGPIHERTTPGTHWKFLEYPAKQNKEKVLQILRSIKQ